MRGRGGSYSVGCVHIPVVAGGDGDGEKAREKKSIEAFVGARFCNNLM